MTIKLSHTIIQVHDQDEALAFYRDVVGLVPCVDVTMDNGYRWLSLGPADQPDVQIVLEDVTVGRAPADAEALGNLLAKGSLSAVIFAVDDCDAFFEKARASGAEVMQEPVEQPYGVRDCAFRDPSGNHLRFAAPLKR
ncbi:VOC family protein [Saccharothrix coeruleofusca]|uniref:Lyase n=1 Tax=Saccharothrix coeruleofusca TaxID=33919 RepID=A0A918AKY0_9PSEU|nr:VOC family protein [Saccharothrix coeruleofusca]GGP50713.1 lyase [Saccharothrix coeruleofusca]